MHTIVPKYINMQLFFFTQLLINVEERQELPSSFVS